MAARDVAESVQNLDQRLARVEQILPTLATKEDLKPLATKDELREAVAKLATKEELAEAVAKLATKEELAEAVAKLATKEELAEAVRREGEESRTHMDVLFERLEGKIQVFAEGHAALEERDARQHAETLQALTALDKRVMALEAARPRRGRG